jgi:UDP-GlcNAc:undecaprenyl-phosphate GlcNAc-1-phosphate transferase
LSIYLLLALGSAVLAVILTPLVARGSWRLGLVDAPGGRKVHAESVPRLGGVAIVAASMLGMILAAALAPGRPAPEIWTALRPLLLAGGLIFLVGALDDIWGLGPAPKLAVELVAALIVMISGLLIQRVTVLGVSWDLGWLAWPITVVWLVGLTNAFNLIDGIDGLVAGITVIAGSACGAILVVRGHPAEAALLAAVVGAALGFLVYNFTPASIFLGDCGSLLIGFILAATAIAGWQKGATALAAGVPLLIFALPIADSAGALIRRGFKRSAAGPVSIASVLRQLAEPDRQHIHHRLMALGWSTRRTVLILYAVTGVLSMLALATARVDPP